MRSSLLALVFLLCIAAPVSAHHVLVTAAVSDKDALESARVEVVEQAKAVGEALTEYQLATSAAEKATAGNLVETAITASIEHVAALDVRECFAPWHKAAVDMFDSVAAGFALQRSGVTGPIWAEANARYNLVLSTDEGVYFASLFCNEVVV